MGLAGTAGLLVTAAHAQMAGQGEDRPFVAGGFEDEGLVLPPRETLNAAMPASITIDTSAEGHPVHPMILGTNHVWYWSERYAGVAPGEYNPEYFEALEGFPMPLARMAGTDSQMFNWKQAVGPLEARTLQKTRNQDQPNHINFGPLEWIESMLDFNPDTRFAWVLNFREDSAQDHGDLAELLVGVVGENRNGGKDWAKVRADYGFEEPLEIEIWELANELEHDRWNVTYQMYHDWCVDAIKAIRQIDPDAEFAALAATSPWRPTRDPNVDWRQWHRDILNDFGDDLKYLVFHPYYHGVHTIWMDKYLAEIEKDIIRKYGKDRIKLYLSEHARWPSRGEPTATNKRGVLRSVETHNLEGSLATSEFLNQMFNNEMVAAAGYHSLSGGPWHVIRKDDDSGQFYTTGIYDLFVFYEDALGDTVIPTKVRGEQTNLTDKSLSFTSLAMRDGEAIHLMITNRDGQFGRKTKINPGGDYTIAACRVLTGESLESFNGYQQKEIGVVEPSTDGLDLDAFYVPPHAIVMLRLEPTE
jgi:alpha-L-arabinofuranosidase